jgi:hypothetical protein
MTVFRPVGPSELHRIAGLQDPFGNGAWAAGAVQVILNFEHAPGGGTAVDVTARIIARSHTRFPLMRPSDWHRVPSNGALEKDIANAVEAQCGATGE